MPRIVQLNEHPLLLQAYELSVEVDKLPAHVDQTVLITALGEWRDKLRDHQAIIIGMTSGLSAGLVIVVAAFLASLF